MTQHLLPGDTEADHRTMRRLAAVIGIFVACTAVMAITVGMVMG